MGVAAQAIEDVEAMVLAARKELARRRVRRNSLDDDYFAEGAWNMLLHLYIAAREERHGIRTKEAVSVADVPYTTALRWLDLLEQAGEIARRSSEEDARVTLILLSAIGSARVERALTAMIAAERAIYERWSAQGSSPYFQSPTKRRYSRY